MTAPRPWTLSSDQLRAIGLDKVRQLEVLKFGHVLEISEANALAASLGDDITPEQQAGYEALISNNSKAVAEYDIRIAAILDALPADGA